MIKNFLVTFLAHADSGARKVVIATAAIMAAVVSAQVVMRYVFNGSFDWADEISRLAFVTTIFIAIPLGIRDGTHVSIDIFVAKFPAPLGGIVQRATYLIAGLMLLLVAWTAINVAGVTWNERMGAINITSAVFFFPIIVGALHSALHLLQMAADPETPIP
ncbi:MULTISPECIES: TRAP transporter small permease [Falsihalocynthiibacter]|uniref:TRAP transporter small permease n=1 Tax=Falsihalocynthiibacter TaxID=2854182 RepID=UPI0030010B37